MFLAGNNDKEGARHGMDERERMVMQGEWDLSGRRAQKGKRIAKTVQKKRKKQAERRNKSTGSPIHCRSLGLGR